MTTIANIEPITEPQVKFLGSLRAELLDLSIKISEAKGDAKSVQNLTEHSAQILDVSGLSKRDARGQIDSLLNQTLPTLRATLRNLTARHASKQVEEGYYVVSDQAVKVQVAGHGGAYAKRLDLETKRWEYVPGLVTECTPDRRMTLEQAEQFSAQISRCIRCSRTLTAADSIARGIGPICAGKF